MRQLAIFMLCNIFAVASAADWRLGAGYLELEDRLDRPADGYCLDVAGSGDWVDFSMPLNAHNCKVPGFYADGAVTFDSPGEIRFPAYEGCVTAVGLRGRSLPGAALMVKPCSGSVDQAQMPFVAASLQQFVHRSDGRIELVASGLCLAVGIVSASTFSPDHRWRPLFLQNCQDLEPTQSVWKRFRPHDQ